MRQLAGGDVIHAGRYLCDKEFRSIQTNTYNTKNTLNKITRSDAICDMLDALFHITLPDTLPTSKVSTIEGAHTSI